ncbi:MAG: DUF1570 domain-containing protein [Planctomycetota bacterium]
MPFHASIAGQTPQLLVRWHRLVIRAMLPMGLILFGAGHARGQGIGNLNAGGWMIPGMVKFPSPSNARLRAGEDTGLLLTRSANVSVVLGRDGAMHRFRGTAAGKLEPIGGDFKALSAVELRQRLLREYGADFEVLATTHFLVVQPAGRGDRWPRLFEASHRGFLDFMNQRQVRVRKGNFPMVAVVMPDEASMQREMRRHEIQLGNVAGVYSGAINRVITHDDAERAQAAATVRHEAAHQSAYNTGVHSRVNATPKWITEGIGQMFEPAAMTNHRRGASVADQINRYSLRQLQGRLERPEILTDVVARLIREDSMFSDARQIDQAYDVSWAMMFYLAQRQPEVFARVLNETSTRPAFEPYTAAQRLRDFEKWVGEPPAIFGRQLSWYLRSL